MRLFTVNMQVLNMHEMMKLETRLNRLGRVLFQGSLSGADEKYRPTIRGAIFLVAVKHGDVRRFKIMLGHLEREMKSRIFHSSLY